MTNLKKSGILPATSVEGSGYWLSPVPGTATVPLLMRKAAGTACADIVLLGNIFYP
jgi:hypothetical protein